VRVVVIGAGPCGLACARELNRLGHLDWELVERSTMAGGSASSELDAAGFTWDYGGHVVFSHFGEFDELLVESMGRELVEHERSSYVRVGDRWVPYPFQNNLRHLPPELAYECIAGLLDAPGVNGEVVDFERWITTCFGEGIARHFMRPYNAKVWVTPLSHMSSSWIAERVSVPDSGRSLRNIILQQDDPAWGPNSTFQFPATGGTGEIYRRLAARFESRITYSADVVAVDQRERSLTLADGRSVDYDVLVSTMPLDRLFAACSGECPADVRAAGEALEHNSVVIVGVGLEEPLADDRSWLYFPAADVPFYRATNFAKYAAANVPAGDTGRFSSYLTETAYRQEAGRPADLGRRTLDGLVSSGVATSTANVASIHHIDLDYAYPIPTVGRDRALATIQPWLTSCNILSRGRFGGWRYEVGNMDHAVKMGIDVARLVVEGRPETLAAT
jgi:protoporphyrinogen oxidase